MYVSGFKLPSVPLPSRYLKALYKSRHVFTPHVCPSPMAPGLTHGSPLEPLQTPYHQTCESGEWAAIHVCRRDLRPMQGQSKAQPTRLQTQV